jgi:hypothetical protein
VDAALSEERCAGHDALAEELRAHATGVLNLLEPWIKQVREAPAPAGGTPVTCESCPLCALMALLRGERSEMAARLAEQATGLVAVLRAALAEGNGAGAGSRAGSESRAGTSRDSGANGAQPAPDDGRDVQRIPVSRVDGGTASGHC